MEIFTVKAPGRLEAALPKTVLEPPINPRILLDAQLLEGKYFQQPRHTV